MRIGMSFIATPNDWIQRDYGVLCGALEVARDDSIGGRERSQALFLLSFMDYGVYISHSGNAAGL